MNNELFQKARSAYVTKDYESALAQFTDCLQDADNPLEPGEMGLLYHQIGNCLVKLHDPEEAIRAYTQAGFDRDYESIGAVNYNLGMVYASQHDYEDAVDYFKKAIEDDKYPTPFKAHQAMGNALLKLGKSAEAGASFRTAALDERNPDPTRALLNLGVCFMALNRPMDAVASYESALQFDMSPSTRNKLFANMGQAYVSAGKNEKAVKAFETALADKTYVFNDAANVDYQRAVAAVAAGVSEVVEPEPENDLSGLDVPADGVPLQDVDASSQATTIMQAVQAPSESGFFDPVTSNNGDFEDWGQVATKKKRRGGCLKFVVVLLVLVVVLIGGTAVVITQGLGFPSKEEVVTDLMANPQSEDVYASSLDDSARKQIADTLVSDTTASIEGSSVTMTTAKVYVQATAEGGSKVNYEIDLVREGASWKVNGASFNFASQQD